MYDQIVACLITSPFFGFLQYGVPWGDEAYPQMSWGPKELSTSGMDSDEHIGLAVGVCWEKKKSKWS